MISKQDGGASNVSGEPYAFAGTEVAYANNHRIVCRNVAGHEACLSLLEEDDRFYLTLSYRGRNAKVRLAEGENPILSVGVVTFTLSISELNSQGGILTMRIRLKARTAVGSVTIINEKVTVRIGGGFLRTRFGPHRRRVGVPHGRRRHWVGLSLRAFRPGIN